MASTDGSNAEPTRVSSSPLRVVLRTLAKSTLCYGTLILRATSDLAERISATAFPELVPDSSGIWWSPSADPTAASQRSTESVGQPTTCTELHLEDLESHYRVASDGPWFVMHAEPLRNMLHTVADSGDSVQARQNAAECLMADLEIEAMLHGDEGDHPEILDDEIAEQLTNDD